MYRGCWPLSDHSGSLNGGAEGFELRAARRAQRQSSYFALRTCPQSCPHQQFAASDKRGNVSLPSCTVVALARAGEQTFGSLRTRITMAGVQ